MVIGFLGTSFAGTTQKGSDATSEKLETATFAGGCFWCMQPPFDKLDGVISTTVGYCGGREKNPTYKQVSSGSTGHAEAIKIAYDPARASYSELLDVFWRNINPIQKDGQFVDKGRQYRTAIFYHNDKQKELAEASRDKLENSEKFDEKIATEIVPVTPFYDAEEYHQDYYKKNSIRYKLYRFGSGRDQYRLKKWGKKE